jgi:DNA polymerase-3 subunit epsilon/CBS domain-containing protein
MALETNATPLVAIDALVVDTETTGPDARKALIVELAALRLRRGQIDEQFAFRRLIDPGEPIPAASIAIHNITDADVAGSARFAAVWPDFAEMAGRSVLIGHMLGFDLAVIRRECDRAGLPFSPPCFLDTRFLAQIAAPQLASYSLDGLASWLDVEVTARHSALGDARTTADVFRALVPLLRERGIRTLGEALQASRRLTEPLEDQHRAGWVDAALPAQARTVLGRIDTYPYRHRVRDAMSEPPRSVPSGTSLRDVIAQLAAEKISSLFVGGAAPGDALVAKSTGIITERDALRAIAAHGAGALDLPVDKFASRPLVTIPEDDFVYRAHARMGRMKIRHLAIVDRDGRVTGALSARDLLRLRAQDAVSLDDEIEQAQTRRDLAAAWPKLPQVAAALRAEGVSGADVAAVISEEVCAITRQAAMIAERRLLEAGDGPPPCPYALAVLGSAGRGESLLALDQDNALVFAQGEPGGPEDLWFEKLATRVNAILDEAGVPLCKGGVMAKNAQWRGSLATWQARVRDWIVRSRPQDLLSVDIFFDLRGVNGDPALTQALRRFAFDEGKDQTGFLKLLAESAGRIESGLSFLGGIKATEGRIDLKMTGTFGVVTCARVLAIRHDITERSTLARLAALRALNIGSERDLEALAEAERLFLDLILDQQVADIAAGHPPSNKVEVKRLSRRDRERLQTALKAVQVVEELTRVMLFRG